MFSVIIEVIKNIFMGYLLIVSYWYLFIGNLGGMNNSCIIVSILIVKFLYENFYIIKIWMCFNVIIRLIFKGYYFGYYCI